MNEASKTNEIRPKDFAAKYLQGKILDIGAGSDLVCASAQGFDVQDGDANNITDYLPVASFDTVHSSHCLEHMFDPEQALEGWWALVKPGGYLVIVVPEETLYEQHFFPSIVNDDHKSTFRFQTHDTWSSRSFDIYELCKRLPDSSIISAMIQDHGYDRRYIYPKGKPALKKMPRLYKLGISLIKRMPVIGKKLEIRFRIHLIKKRIPFDQTKFEALAQIEIIVKKVVKV